MVKGNKPLPLQKAQFRVADPLSTLVIDGDSLSHGLLSNLICSDLMRLSLQVEGYDCQSSSPSK